MRTHMGHIRTHMGHIRTHMGELSWNVSLFSTYLRGGEGVGFRVLG